VCGRIKKKSKKNHNILTCNRASEKSLKKGHIMDLATAKKRILAVRGQLKRHKVQALIVVSVENVRYLTGFTGHDSWALVLPDKAILITDSRYTEQARGQCAGCSVFERKGALTKTAADFIGKTKRIRSIGIEDECSVAILKAVQKAVKQKIVPVRGIIEQLRSIKIKEEVRAIETAAKIAWKALRMTLPLLKAGMTEMELAAALEFHIKQLGATPGFDTIVCFGANASRNHHQPGRRKLRKNDTILIDFGCNYKGYVSDITRCFVYGKPTPYYKKVYEAVMEAQKTAIAMIKPGVCMADVDTACRKVLVKCKVAVYGHGTGHGLGLQVHENPRISATAKKEVFQAGQVITVEPGSYVSGKIGVRIEDDILVTEKGHKILSHNKDLCFDPAQMPILKNK
jgi:Xaa-Pro aminopeptidase